jgi:hypothetical protein
MKRRAPLDADCGQQQANTDPCEDSSDSPSSEINLTSSSGALSPIRKICKPGLITANKRHGLPPLKPMSLSRRPDKEATPKRDVVTDRVAKLLESYLDTVLDQDQDVSEQTGKASARSAAADPSNSALLSDSRILVQGQLSADTSGDDQTVDRLANNAGDAFRLFEDSPRGLVKDGRPRVQPRTELTGKYTNNERPLSSTDGTVHLRGGEVSELNSRKRRRKNDQAPESLHEVQTGYHSKCSPKTRESSSDSDDDSIERKKVASVVVTFVP